MTAIRPMFDQEQVNNPRPGKRVSQRPKSQNLHMIRGSPLPDGDCPLGVVQGQLFRIHRDGLGVFDPDSSRSRFTLAFVANSPWLSKSNTSSNYGSSGQL